MTCDLIERRPDPMKSPMKIPWMLTIAVLVIVAAPAAAQNRKKGIFAKGCSTTSCHTDLKDVPHLHGPVAAGSCTICHRPIGDAHKFKPIETDQGESCLICHRRPIKKPTRTIASIAKVLEEARTRHDAITVGGCVTCHDPHGSEFPAYTRFDHPGTLYQPYKPGSYELCFQCHIDSMVTESRGDSTRFRNGDANLHHLHVNRKKGRTCGICHEPHTSKGPNRVRKKLAFGAWEMAIEFAPTKTGGSCATGCHPLYKYDRESPVLNNRRLKP